MIKNTRFAAVALIIVVVLVGCGEGKIASKSFHVYSNLDTADVAIGDIARFQVWAMGADERNIEFPRLEVDNANISVGEGQYLTGENEGDKGIEFQLTFWDTGAFDIPPYVVQILTEDGKEVDYAIPTDPVTVTVHSLISEAQPKLRDIKPPVPIPTIVPWKIILSLLGIGLSMAILFWMWRKRVKEEQVEKEEVFIPSRPPYEIAMEKLDQLKEQTPTGPDQIKNFYAVLSYLVREYLEFQYFVRAIEMTTSEIEDARYLVPTDQEKLHNVITVLKRADLAKFARFQPDLNQSKEDLKMIEDFLKSTRLSWTTVKNGVKPMEAV